MARLIEGESIAVLIDQVTRLLGSRPTPALDLLALVAVVLSVTAVARMATKRRENLTWPIVAAFVVFTFAMGTVPRFYTIKKVIAPFWPLVILAVVGLASSWTRARYAFGLLTAASVVATIWMVIGVPKDDWRAVTGFLAETTRDGSDVVWLDPASDAFAYNYYTPRNAAISGGGTSLDEAATGPGVLWLIVQRRPGTVPPGSPSEAWLDANRTLVRAVPFDRLEARAYQRDAGR